MNDSLLVPHNLPPICMTYQQLRYTLEPLAAGYPWAEGTIRDLWMLGSPQPPMGPGARIGEDVRLIVPSQFIAWLEDVLKRQGRPLSDSARLYAQMIKDGN